jgi:hypothetical protein
MDRSVFSGPALTIAHLYTISTGLPEINFKRNFGIDFE